MVPLRTLAVVVALLSLVANALLVVRRVRASASPPTEAATEDPATEVPEPAAERPLSTCRSELATLAGEAQRLTVRLSPNAPLPELFRLNEPNQAGETALAPRLSRMFQVGPGPVRDHRVECRGAICRLTFLAGEGVDAEAWRAFFRDSDEVRSRVRVVRMEPPFPTYDAVTHESLSEWRVFLHLKNAEGR
jgi:hypothetical protein